MGEKLKGRVAIVTGGGGGIGRGVSKWLAREGASVVVNALGGALDGSGGSRGPADVVIAEVKTEGGNAIASYDTVATFQGAERIVQKAIDTYGRLDILCHAAGVLSDRMVFNMTEDEWDTVVQTHLYGAFNIVRHAVPHMVQQRYGRILLFSSVSALGNVGQANYSSAKAGQIGLANALARELAPHNITVNVVFPGGDTRMTQGLPETSQAYIAQWGAPSAGAEVPDLRDPERNAPKVAYLCTEAAANITGRIFGTFGLPMTLYSQRQAIKVLHKDAPWTLEELETLMPSSLTQGLVNTMVPDHQAEGS